MKIEKIKDFIKSFFYYPKMRKYFRNRKMEQYDIWKSAIKYAWWHCSGGKLDDCTNEPLNNVIEKDEWKTIYKKEQIEVMKNENSHD